MPPRLSHSVIGEKNRVPCVAVFARPLRRVVTADQNNIRQNNRITKQITTAKYNK
jgi:hypothetical protein